MSSNYTIMHCHTHLSNGVTNIDSVTKYQEYIDAAKELGMTAIAFTEHGSLFSWWNKKCAVEEAGMRYIHSVEAYITESLDEKVRDNYHCVLTAKNFEGFKELNRLVSASFNRDDNHFYYVPRISYDELLATSDNILVSTACIAGILSKGNDQIKERFKRFCIGNKHRVFLEVGHHSDCKQYEYNKELAAIASQYGLRLIAGTDTHALNKTHVDGRHILQISKNIHFEDEDNWDLTMKTYDELVDAYRKQGALSQEVYLQAIENTNVYADLCEDYEIDCNIKYPRIYDEPEKTFVEKINAARESHPYVNARYPRERIDAVIEEELSVYKATKSIDFMLLQTYMREWEREQGIQCGYGRGSVSGSMIAYILGITQMDSIKFGLNFFRFMNPSRVTNADIDTDYSSKDRDRVKQFLLRDHMNLDNIKSSEIITFNTIAMKGAIKDVGRALDMPVSQTQEISNAVTQDENKKWVIDQAYRIRYPELFKYVDIVDGTVVSVGTHPSGVLVTDKNIVELIGLCSTSSSPYGVSMLDMKELDKQFWVKLDLLGLDNIGVINETCELANIERHTPDNTDLEDMAVWKSIRDDTTLIFQWESDSAQAYIRKFMSDATLKKAKALNPNFSMIKWLSFGNGLIRPACTSYRNDVADGKFYDNGFDELNKFLVPEMGHVCMQETIMQFLVHFCGYSNAESDNVRRAIAKKKGTETLLPEIEQRFIEYAPQHYDISPKECEQIIKPFIQVILDASSYAFSWNHSDSYSCTGYVCGFLRHYYPFEFITAALNVFQDNEDKTKAITQYAQQNKITITPPRFGFSKDDYYFDKEKRVISKGIASIKYINKAVANQLYELSKAFAGDSFVDLLYRIANETKVNSRQLEILIKIDYFLAFGNSTTLLQIYDAFNFFKEGTAKQIKKDKVGAYESIIERFATDKNDKGAELKSYTITDCMGLLHEWEKHIRSLPIKDIDYKVKMQQQLELLGYIDLTTNKEEDRKKLLVTSKPIALTNKEDGSIWAYRVDVKSIGSGKANRVSIRAKVFDNEPIQMGDIVYADDVSKNNKGYWYLNEYHQVLM